MLDRCEGCGSNNIKLSAVVVEYMGKTIKKVPAIICTDCGEEMITSDVLARVDRLVQSGIKTYQFTD